MIEPLLKDERFLEDVERARREQDRLHLWWLGQSGFLIHWRKSCLLIDPYLSDSLTRKYASTDKPHIRMTARVVAPEASVAARYVGLLLQIQGATINDVYEARMISEPPCARLLALRRTDEDIDKLTAVVDELKAEVAARKPFIPDPYVWSRLTYRFHELILEGCGNKTMAVQGAVLQDIVATHLRTKIARRDDSDTDERFQLVIRSYMKLISLVKAGNAAGAEKHWRSHMEGAATYLLKDDLKTKPVVDLFD